MWQNIQVNSEWAVPNRGGVGCLYGGSILGRLSANILLVPMFGLTQGPFWQVHTPLSQDAPQCEDVAEHVMAGVSSLCWLFPRLRTFSGHVLGWEILLITRIVVGLPFTHLGSHLPASIWCWTFSWRLDTAAQPGAHSISYLLPLIILSQMMAWWKQK